MEPHDPAPLLDRLTALVAADDRFVAVLLFGSHATGTADAFSDVDIGVVVADDAQAEVIAHRDALLRAMGEPLFAEHFDNPANVHVINADGTAYELILTTAAALDLSRPYRVVLDKGGAVEAASARRSAPAPDATEHARQLVAWFWHDLEHVITALGRGQLLWAHGGLEEMRGVCIGLARVVANAELEPDDPYWKVDSALPADVADRLRASVVPIERAALLSAAHALVSLYRELAQPVARSAGIPYPDTLDRLLTDRLADLA